MRPLTRVEVRLPSGRLPDGKGTVTAGFVRAGPGGEGGDAIPVRLRPAPASPALLPARPGPALPGVLALADGSGGTADVRLVVTPVPLVGDGGAAPGPAGQPAPLAATLATLASGLPLAGLVLPRRAGGRPALDIGGGLVLRLGREAADGLPAGAAVQVRLDGPPNANGGEDAASVLRLALTGTPTGKDAQGPERLAADALLGARLQALSEGLDRPPGPEGAGRAGAEAMAAACYAMLGGPSEPPVPLRLARERDAPRRGAGGAEEGAGRLVLDITFARLGRFRIEVDRPGDGAGDLRIALRTERALPAGAHAELLDRVGAAFEIGGARALFVVSTGGLPSPAAPTRAVSA